MIISISFGWDAIICIVGWLIPRATMRTVFLINYFRSSGIINDALSRNWNLLSPTRPSAGRHNRLTAGRPARPPAGRPTHPPAGRPARPPAGPSRGKCCWRLCWRCLERSAFFSCSAIMSASLDAK